MTKEPKDVKLKAALSQSELKDLLSCAAYMKHSARFWKEAACDEAIPMTIAVHPDAIKQFNRWAKLLRQIAR